MLTADTITDEQIRELQRSVAGHAFPAAGMAHTELSEVWEDCRLALGLPCTDSMTLLERNTFWLARDAARARCAEILNACAAKSEGIAAGSCESCPPGYFGVLHHIACTRSAKEPR